MTEPALVGVELQAEVESCHDCDYPHLCPLHAAAYEAMREDSE